MVDFKELSKSLILAGIMCGKPKPQRYKFPDSAELLKKGMAWAVGEDYQWLKPYEQVAEWLADTDSKGLILMGSCGQGKSEIVMNILPLLFHHYYGKLLHTYDSTYMAKHPDELLAMKMLCVDDIGTEGESVSYGERRQAFAELVDAAEKHGHLLILTTNLGVAELESKYGMRVVDRLKSLCKCIVFNGKSLRH